jgi:hypothetical protein
VIAHPRHLHEPPQVGALLSIDAEVIGNAVAVHLLSQTRDESVSNESTRVMNQSSGLMRMFL